MFLIIALEEGEVCWRGNLKMKLFKVLGILFIPLCVSMGQAS